jgi:hypothetical protein
MPTYLVQVVIPAIYVIDAMSPQRAMDKADKRFQHEYHTRITPEFQWAQLKGSAHDAEWVVVHGEDLPSNRQSRGATTRSPRMAVDRRYTSSPAADTRFSGRRMALVR